MQLSDSDIELIKQYNPEFISLKYLGKDSLLQQIDISVNSLSEDFLIDDELFSTFGLNLKPINNKSFIDPFRSFPTISVFCENIIDGSDLRKLSINSGFPEKLEARISFWVVSDGLRQESYGFAADPVDQYANLRSDIIATLEKINIKTTAHFHGESQAESVITIKGDNIIDLSDNIIIAKFIIENIANNYNLCIKFYLENLTNLSLILKGNKDKITKILDYSSKAIEKNLDKQASKNIAEIKIINIEHYQKNPKFSVLEINLLCNEAFVPYVALWELLSYSR